MLDKDFDAFFKSSLEDYEITPTADSWTKISEQINSKSRKSFPVFWMAAASIVIVLGFGIGLFTKPTEVIKLHPDKETEMIANLVKEQKTSVNNSETETEIVVDPVKKSVTTTTVGDNLAKDKIAVGTVANNERTVADEPLTAEIVAVKSPKALRPKLVAEQLLTAEEIINLKKNEAIMLDDNQHTFIASAADKPNPAKKNKISSMGDLVNFVVAKVDKRDDKIITMSKTDESDNEITGINLGLFKFNKLD